MLFRATHHYLDPGADRAHAASLDALFDSFLPRRATSTTSFPSHKSCHSMKFPTSRTVFAAASEKPQGIDYDDDADDDETLPSNESLDGVVATGDKDQGEQKSGGMINSLESTLQMKQLSMEEVKELIAREHSSSEKIARIREEAITGDGGSPLAQKLEKIQRMFPSGSGMMDIFPNIVKEGKRQVSKAASGMKNLMSTDGLAEMLNYVQLFQMKTQQPETVKTKMDLLLNPSMQENDDRGPQDKHIRPPVHVTMAPAYEDMSFGGQFARPPSTDEIYDLPPVQWDVPVYHFNPLLGPSSTSNTHPRLSATRGWPGTSGGPKGTLMPLPVGLNTQVVQATDYELERPDPFIHRTNPNYQLPVPWIDASMGNRKPDTSAKQMLGDQGIAVDGISQARSLQNRKIYDPDYFATSLLREAPAPERAAEA
ncbi:unnamed protein product [Amoebophrya sp. A120]|nr:unnamed protein product [Amoebophrya sp. A120]|eukprot:GSA120T00018720001.1